MIIERIVIENYRLIRHADFLVNSDMNVFVGDNDSGKSTLLEALTILTSGKLNGFAFERQLKANLFNDKVRRSYIDSLSGTATVQSPPRMLFEAYCVDSDDEPAPDNCTTNKVRGNMLHNWFKTYCLCFGLQSYFCAVGRLAYEREGTRRLKVANVHIA